MRDERKNILSVSEALWLDGEERLWVMVDIGSHKAAEGELPGHRARHFVADHDCVMHTLSFLSSYGLR